MNQLDILMEKIAELREKDMTTGERARSWGRKGAAIGAAGLGGTVAKLVHADSAFKGKKRLGEAAVAGLLAAGMGAVPGGMIGAGAGALAGPKYTKHKKASHLDNLMEKIAFFGLSKKKDL